MHIDRVLERTVDGGTPTVANDALRYVYRMFKRRCAIDGSSTTRLPASSSRTPGRRTGGAARSMASTTTSVND